MSGPTERDIERVAGCIQRYLARHPAAADSDEGIAQWWLPAMGEDVPLETVRGALEQLVQAGVVLRTPVTGGPAIYRAAAGRGAPRGG